MLRGAAVFTGRLVIVVVVLGVMMVASIISGCGGPPKAARTALAVSAAGVAAADIASAPVYERRAASCLEEHETAAGYRECVGRVDDLEDGLRIAHRALLASQASIDAWDAGADDGAGFLATAPCLAEALAQLIAAMTAAGARVPESMSSGVDLIGAYGGACAQ